MDHKPNVAHDQISRSKKVGFRWPRWLTLTNAQTIIQILALIAGGMWALFNTFGLGERAKEEFSVSASSELKVELLRRLNEETGLYFVTYTTWLHNESERLSHFSYYCVNIYRGTALSQVHMGLVAPPVSGAPLGPGNWTPGHPFVKWSLFAEYSLCANGCTPATKGGPPRSFASVARDYLDSQKPETSSESSKIESFGLPAHQKSPLRVYFVVLASERDWLSVSNVIAVDQDSKYKDTMADYVIENIGTAVSKDMQADHGTAQMYHSSGFP